MVVELCAFPCRFVMQWYCVAPCSKGMGCVVDVAVCVAVVVACVKCELAAAMALSCCSGSWLAPVGNAAIWVWGVWVAVLCQLCRFVGVVERGFTHCCCAGVAASGGWFGYADGVVVLLVLRSVTARDCT